MTRKIVFITGTRADFGKLKPLIRRLDGDEAFAVHVFVTGMHTLARYGSTWDEVRKTGVENLYRFINQNHDDSMDHVLAKTVLGFSDYVRELDPNLIVVHGDRVEALAGAIVGALTNKLVAHVEGGEVSGTIDESIRHAISKFAHVHFVSNERAKGRMEQLGEDPKTIHAIGSPEVDIINSGALPEIDDVRQYYEFDFDTYALLMFHPVTTELDDLRRQARTVVNAVLASGRNYVVVYPNNDSGTHVIFEEYERLKGLPRIKIYPSMRFEYFLSTLKHAEFIIGNSSTGVREAPYFGVPAINIGSRQKNRARHDSIIDVDEVEEAAVSASIARALAMPRIADALFGAGNSADRFYSILSESSFWAASTQKHFFDLDWADTL